MSGKLWNRVVTTDLLPLLKKLISLLCFMADCGVFDLPGNTAIITVET
jgi:hypothetical protein